MGEREGERERGRERGREDERRNSITLTHTSMARHNSLRSGEAGDERQY